LRNLPHEEEGAKGRDENQDHHIGKCKESAGKYAALRGHAKGSKQINEIGWLEVIDVRKAYGPISGNVQTARYI
jgi:hypothetical protein